MALPHSKATNKATDGKPDTEAHTTLKANNTTNTASTEANTVNKDNTAATANPRTTNTDSKVNTANNNTAALHRTKAMVPDQTTMEEATASLPTADLLLSPIMVTVDPLSLDGKQTSISKSI